MAAIVWLIAILLIVCTLIGIVLFKDQTDKLEKEFNSDVICPVNSLEMKKEAYEDYILEKD
jgi:hypothetical protein